MYRTIMTRMYRMRDETIMTNQYMARRYRQWLCGFSPPRWQFVFYLLGFGAYPDWKDSDPRLENILKYDRAMSAVEWTGNHEQG